MQQITDPYKPIGINEADANGDYYKVGSVLGISHFQQTCLAILKVLQRFHSSAILVQKRNLLRWITTVNVLCLLS
jgi:hypothetical protein